MLKCPYHVSYPWLNDYRRADFGLPEATGLARHNRDGSERSGCYLEYCSTAPVRAHRRGCADKAYLSRKICDLVARHGGRPYVSVKKNVARIRAQGSKAWRETLVMWRRSRKLYRKRYHRRSLAETAVSTVKRRFSHTLCSTKRRAQKNELRLKVLTYNLSIVARLPHRIR
ncbi:MAG: transposase [Nitrososphaerota archaeon]|nr:transposase [Nitrososphaerota archaeon]